MARDLQTERMANNQPLKCNRLLLLIINVRFGTHPARVLFSPLKQKENDKKSHLQISRRINSNMVYPTCGM